MGIVIGITGGIATGKSTVANMFREFGAEVLDADDVARQVLAPGSEALREVQREICSEVVAEDGSLDRAKLADIIFADPSARERLNQITHPRIVALLVERIHEFKSRSSACDILVVEIPLLIEANLTAIVDNIVLAYAEQEAQQNRLRMRSSLTSAQIDQRISSQMPIQGKIPYADWIVTTDCSLEETKSQSLRVWEAIRSGCVGSDAR